MSRIDIAAETRWAVGWLVGLIGDGRVEDLDQRDEYVQRTRDLLDTLDLAADSGDMTLSEFEERLLNTENPLTTALDMFFRDDWEESHADELGHAIIAAIEQAREDKLAGVLVP